MVADTHATMAPPPRSTRAPTTSFPADPYSGAEVVVTFDAWYTRPPTIEFVVEIRDGRAPPARPYIPQPTPHTSNPFGRKIVEPFDPGPPGHRRPPPPYPDPPHCPACRTELATALEAEGAAKHGATQWHAGFREGWRTGQFRGWLVGALSIAVCWLVEVASRG